MLPTYCIVALNNSRGFVGPWAAVELQAAIALQHLQKASEVKMYKDCSYQHNELRPSKSTSESRSSLLCTAGLADHRDTTTSRDLAAFLLRQLNSASVSFGDDLFPGSVTEARLVDVSYC